ncbi:hypothetical protein A5763_12625 [Mycolicibacterium fortuitum]|nr:hypothetical protein A5763_12625 [Mycolicibacterium fortuitum]
MNVDGSSIVIGRVGSYCGSVYYSPSSCWVTDNAIIAAAVDPIETRFWYYALTSVGLNRWSHGSGQPLLNQSILSAIPFDAPPPAARLKIAATLGAIDDRIESNRRLIRLIPDLVRAKVDAALQTDSKSVAVASLARFINGGAYTKDATGTGRMVIRIADLNSGPGPSTVYTALDVPEDKTARPGDILMSWSGSLGVYRWFREEAIVNQHIFKVLPSDYPDWLVFDRLEHVLEVFRGIARDKATTMGHIQRGHLESTSVDIPNPTVVGILTDELGPVWKRLLVAEQECMRLEHLRDALLPELLSGRIRVPETAQAIA